MTSRLPLRRNAAVTTCLLAAALTVAPAGTAFAGSKPRMGLYDCLTPSLYAGGVAGSIKLKKKGKYDYAAYRKGKKLSKPITKGRWRTRGKKVIFKSGVIKGAGFYGVWTPPSPTTAQGFIGLYSIETRQFTHITCRPILPNETGAG